MTGVIALIVGAYGYLFSILSSEILTFPLRYILGESTFALLDSILP